MTDQHDSNPRSQQIDAAIAEYLEAAERGQPLDREAFLARHAEIAAELREFLADYSALEHNAPHVDGGSGRDPTTDFSGDPANRLLAAQSQPLDVVRYFGDYELLEEIARGGMGVVYKARQTTLGRTVAVKMILAGQLASQAEVDRFYAEAQSAATLDHPNIVPIFEVGQHQGQHYFSMGYVAGQSLAQRVLNGPLPPREAATIIRDVAHAVHYAHGQGVIHRDLKPANILFDGDGHPRITDFGLAKRQTDASGLTATGQVLGTPSFMPPEQISSNNGKVGAAADVYSLGATLYALLTGRPPFQSASAIDTLKQVLEKEPVPLREFDASLPRDLETITLKCLEKSPSRRYESAQALAAELDRYLTGRPIQARPISRAEHAWRWCRRNPVVAGLMAAVTVSLIIGMLVSTYFAILSSRRANENLNLAKKESEARQSETAARTDAQSQQKRAEDSARTARHQVYDLNMNLAQRAWEDNHIPLLLDLLQRSSPKAGEDDLRGFEWQYWNRLCHRELSTFSVRKKDEPVSEIAMSPNEDILALVYTSKTVELRDIQSGEKVRTLIGEAGRITNDMAFSPDGKQLAAAIRDPPSVAIWDVATGTKTTTLKENGRFPRRIVFSPDGQKLASVDDGEHGQIKGSIDEIESVTLWNLATGESSQDETVKEFRGIGLWITFNSDGQLVGVSGDGSVVQWDASLAQKRATKILPLQNGSYRVLYMENSHSIAASADGNLLALGCIDESIRFLDVKSGTVTKTLYGHRGPIFQVVFSRDGKRLASSGSDKTIKVWDVVSGQEILSFRGQEHGSSFLAFIADDTRLASKTNDFSEIVDLWDIEKAPEPTSRSFQLASNLEESNDFASRNHFGRFVFSTDAKHLAEGNINWTYKGGPSIRQWDTTTGQEELVLANPATPEDSRTVRSVAFSADARQIFATDGIDSIRIWDTASKKEPETLVMPLRGDQAIAVSADGKRLAVLDDRAVNLWDLTGDRRAVSLPGLTEGGAGAPRIGDSDGRVLAFNPAGKLLACAIRDRVHIWNVNTRQEVMTLTGHAGQILTLTFSPDGNRLATGGWDKTIKLWDLSTGLVTLTLSGDDAVVTCLAFSPDSRRMASANTQNIRIWDTFSGQESTTLQRPGWGVSAIAFSTDGHHLLAAWGTTLDRGITVWDLDQ